MKNGRGFLSLFALLVVISLATKAFTGGSGPNGITITSVTPTTGQVAVGGIYSVDTGYTFNNIEVTVRPTGGAAGQGGDGTATANNGNFSATIAAPSGGVYDVQAILTVTDGTGTAYYYFSNLATGVSVP